jgi:hypothetical protein
VSDVREQWRAALAPAAGCVSLERLAETLTDEEREHVARCPRCEAEAALFAAADRPAETERESDDVQWIASELRRRTVTPSKVKVFPARTSRWGLSSLAAAAVLLMVVGIGVWSGKREPSLSQPSGGELYRSARLAAIAPVGDLQAPPAELRWASLPGATNYDVTVREVDHTLLWSAETSASHVQLPQSVLARIVPGKTLVWEVTARRGGEAVASSGAQPFRWSVR